MEGEGQIPVIVYQKAMSVCHVEVLAYGSVHLAPCRNTSAGSATLRNQGLYVCPRCSYYTVDLRRGGEAKRG